MSIDNQVDPEWTTDADGPHKRQCASALAARLKRVWAPGGLVQYSQGKWYPGEPLPRWQIGLHWRTDGEPLWTNDALLADPWPSQPRAIEVAPDAGAQLLGAVADGLGLPPTQVRPAFEDPLSRLLTAVRQPAGEPVSAADDLESDAPDRRAELLAKLDESVAEPAAYVLPLHRRDDDSGWASADWRLRRGRIVLLEGDSPAGLRLPLDSISWKPPRPSHPGRPAGRPRGPACRCGVRRSRRLRFRGRRRIGTHHRAGRRDPRRSAARLSAAHRRARAFRRPRVAGGGRRREDRLPGGDRGLRAAVGSADHVDDHHTRSRRHRGQRGPDGDVRRAAGPAADALRRGPAGPAVDGVVRLRRHTRRNRRRQPHHAGRHHARRLAPAAPTRSAGLDADLLAAAPVAVLSVRRPVRRHHVAGAAGRRGPRRGALRTGDRVRRNRPARGRRRSRQAVGDRSRAAASADRHHRQHPSRRVLHRQALQPRQRARQARSLGAARLRDAAAFPDGDGAVAAGALAGGLVLGRAAAGPADPPRRQSARPIPVAALLDSRHRRRRRRPARPRHQLRHQLAGPVHRVPLPAHRHRGVRRRGDRTARRDRAVERARRGVHRRQAPPATSTRRWNASRSAPSAPTGSATS